jgi:y4mF family transcriptional regulator
MLAQTPGEIGRIIETARRQRKMTQAALAKAIGGSQAWISEVEKGKHSAHIGKVLRTLSYLGVRLQVGEAPWLGSPVITPGTGNISLAGILGKHASKHTKKRRS